MRLASWVSIAVIVFGGFMLVQFATSNPNGGLPYFNGQFPVNAYAMIGERLIIFGLAALTLSEVFKPQKNT